MRLFLVGSQTEELIIDSLDMLDDETGIEEIIGALDSPCMAAAIKWAEYNEVPVSLHMSEDDSVNSTISNHTSIIKIDRPDSLLIYSTLDADIDMHLMELAINPCSSIEQVMRKA